MATLNTNTTATSGISSTMGEYWDRKLLENMKPKLLHLQFGQKRPMPANNGKQVSFRKWTPFGALTTPLTEGTPPAGQSLAQTEITATIAQYGGYVTESDLLDLTAIDNVKMDAAEMMADQGALTLDTLVRDELHTSANVVFANGKTARTALAATDKLTSVEIRKAVRTLKKNRAPMFTTGSKSYYVCIVGPDTEYDLMDDPTWVDVSKYSASEQIFYGEVGTLYGCKVICADETKIFEDQQRRRGLDAGIRTKRLRHGGHRGQRQRPDEDEGRGQRGQRRPAGPGEHHRLEGDGLCSQGAPADVAGAY